MRIVKRDIPGINLYYLPIEKFKTIEVFFVFTNKMDPERFNERNMLMDILGEQTKKYSTPEKLKMACDNLYGLSKLNYYHFEGNLDISMFVASVVNDKYLDENIFSDSFDLLMEIIYNPKMYLDHIPKTSVKERVSQAKALLLSQKQNKNAYAYYQFMQNYTDNNQDHFAFFPMEKYLSKVNDLSITETYHKMVNDDNLEIFIGGDFSFKEMDELIKPKLAKIMKNNSLNLQFYPKFNSRSNVNNVVEKTSTGQTRIFIGYDLNFIYNQKNSLSMSLFNEIFGGFENSKLFKNIREKLNLSYYVYSHYSPGNSLFYVNLETSKENTEQALKEVEKQLEECKNGLFDDALFIQAKNNLINRLETAVDSQSKLLLYNIFSYLRHSKSFDLEDTKEIIAKITKEDLIGLIKQINVDTIYIYTSGGK